jgi:hypothetical protein
MAQPHERKVSPEVDQSRWYCLKVQGLGRRRSIQPRKVSLTNSAATGVCQFSNEATEAVSEPLLDRTVRPYDDGDKTAVFAGFVERILTQLYAPLSVSDTFGIPLSEEFHARVATADCVDDGNCLDRD